MPEMHSGYLVTSGLEGILGCGKKEFTISLALSVICKKSILIAFLNHHNFQKMLADTDYTTSQSFKVKACSAQVTRST